MYTAYNIRVHDQLIIIKRIFCHFKRLVGRSVAIKVFSYILWDLQQKDV